jgi:Arc/MetJ-type ribon-helix-helix transcriptional regulator
MKMPCKLLIVSKIMEITLSQTQTQVLKTLVQQGSYSSFVA